MPEHPPEFAASKRYSLERKEVIDKSHSGNFLWPEERKLVHWLMSVHEQAFAWCDEERGNLREDFFPPVNIPVIPHTPWVEQPIEFHQGFAARYVK